MNLHYHATHILESVRVSYLLANNKAVVCEQASDTEIPDGFDDLVLFSSKENLMETVERLLGDDAERTALADRGKKGFRDMPFGKNLNDALDRMERHSSDGRSHKAAAPILLNVGSGKNFLEDHLNLDIDPKWKPDVLCDLSDPDIIGETFETDRFGSVTLHGNYFYRILATDVLEHILNLTAFMTNIKKSARCRRGN